MAFNAHAGVCNRSPAAVAGIVEAVHQSCDAITSEDLGSLRTLDLFVTNPSMQLRSGDLEGLSSLQSLSLYGTGMTLLPADLLHPTGELKEFNVISAWNLRELPPDFFRNLPHLENVNIIAGLVNLQGDLFRNVPALLSLQIGGAEMFTLSPNALKGLHSLRKLNMDTGRVAELPSALFSDLLNLRELSLFTSVNRFPTVMLGSLHQLESLDFSDEALITLPSGAFTGLDHLHTLRIEGEHSLSAIEDQAFAGLTRLESLTLSSPELRTIPVPLFQGLSGIKLISLQHTGIKELPDGVFDHLPTLEHVHVNLTPEKMQLLSQKYPRVVFSTAN